MYVFIPVTHDTTRGVTPHHRTHGHIDVSVPQKIGLVNRDTAVSKQTLETPENDQCWSKHIVCIRLKLLNILKQVV
jgi:hypothetical protein